MTKSSIKRLLQLHGIHPRKALGQHFLASERLVKRMLDRLTIQKGNAVVEIGPGLGAVTDELLARGAKVYAIEKDIRLAAYLKGKYKDHFEEITIYAEDILNYGFHDIASGTLCQVVGNLPYCASSPILFHVIRHRRVVSTGLFTLQREVARRLTASPGCKDYGRLTVSVGLYADVKRVLNIPRSQFFPAPGVESATVMLTFRVHKKQPSDFDEAMYLRVVKAAFGTRRKTIANALQQGPEGFLANHVIEVLDRCAVDRRSRAENLEIDTFIHLANEFSKLDNPAGEISHTDSRRAPTLR